jgi:hypothetical protein
LFLLVGARYFGLIEFLSLPNILIFMEAKKVHLSDLHFDHQRWLGQLGFYKQELAIFQKRLDEVAVRNNSPEFRQQLSHLQNQLIIQNEQVDIVKHDLKIHEEALAKEAAHNPHNIQHQLYAANTDERERIDIFFKLYEEMKHELLRFLATWL